MPLQNSECRIIYIYIIKSRQQIYSYSFVGLIYVTLKQDSKKIVYDVDLEEGGRI